MALDAGLQPLTVHPADIAPTSFMQHNTMESLLERGEKIDDLVSKSEVLGIHSKAFYKTVGALAPSALGPWQRAGQHTHVTPVLWQPERAEACPTGGGWGGGGPWGCSV